MTTYNLTNIFAANSTQDLMTTVSADLTGGLLGILIIVAIFIILFMAFSFYSVAAAFMVSSFLTTTIAGLAWYFGLIPMLVIIVLMSMLVISIFMVMFTNR